MGNEQKLLYRSSKNKIFAGVCGGLAEYFGLPVIVFRAAFLILTLGAGWGAWLYLLLAIAIPKNPDEEPESVDLDWISDFVADVRLGVQNLAVGIKANTRAGWFRGRTNALGIIVLVIGVILFLNQTFPTNFFMGNFYFPLAIIFLGLALLAVSPKKAEEPPPAATNATSTTPDSAAVQKNSAGMPDDARVGSKQED